LILDLVEVVLGRSQGERVEIVFSKNILTGGGIQENSFGCVEEIPRHLSLYWFGNFWTKLGEIIMA